MGSSKLGGHIVLLGITFLLVAGCGGNASGSGGDPAPTPFPTPDFAFLSSGALDGSNATVGACAPSQEPQPTGEDLFLSNNAINVWGANVNGSLHPITTLTTCSVSVNSPAWSPNGNKIAFVSDRALSGADGIGNSNNIWIMNPDGSGLTALTSTTGATGNLFWSPDGSTIAFSLGDLTTGVTNVWSVRSDGTGLTQLTTVPNATVFPTGWAPNGQKIAFISNGALPTGDPSNTFNDSNLWVMNPDGSGQIPLTQYTYEPVVTVFGTLGVSGVFSPAIWSKDGSKILFIADAALDGSNTRNPVTNAWVINPDGTNPTPITQFTDQANQSGTRNAVWSPDGTKIAYIASIIPINPGNLWVSNADGTNASQITQFTIVNITVPLGLPSWSPDGTRLTFTSSTAVSTPPSSQGFESNIWMVNADGSGLVQLTKLSGTFTTTNGVANAFAPIWRP